ncbi:Gfo/Idh/MocA family protein [Lederbergia galactosidilytica]|uniref:Quinolinate phosphoribosyl transferase n=1 Tax=Lederbergia galactosidilytica TaxID=217031 RepID=A0A177ZKT2_9BACI|nr:Gfo/Idh/MocA family oxidoreductase [Lederbergia galactosidilytica]KRG11153.1 quinolinate phosphoribosyl transferase [Virgibacillus soli]MBP1916027.1 putative dehydrogenase [Lederbergia galactosidilytica]OAK68587.1 quinolinate phosphoribosyl transferase [Lederbergia galactosidilytica]
MRKISIVLVGASGYGHVYLRELLQEENEQMVLAGVVDISPERSKYYQELQEMKIPIYQSLEKFYEENKADLAIISTPIHLHKEHSCLAMNHGSDVLCEKPISTNLADIQKMRETAEETGRFLAVGFNWSFTDSVQQLKKQILAGEFGQAKRFKSLTLWPRDQDYYNRSAWAGKKHSPNGEVILDSIASNATAHHLHHMLYLAGKATDQSASIAELKAELYKANDIETFDTCAVQIKTEENIDVLYLASHAVKESKGPTYVLEFERATISFDQDKESSEIVVEWDNGKKQSYKDPSHTLAKLEVCVQAILRGDHEILCGIEAATPHAKAIQAMHQSVPEIPEFPPAFIQYNESEKLVSVEGLAETWIDCFEKWSLPSELNIKWSQQGKTVKVE